MILDGKKVKKELITSLKEKLINIDKQLSLAIIQVGNDSRSNIYIKQKINMCNILGFKFIHIKLEENIKEEQLIEKIKELNKNDSIDGILIHLPLPKHLNEYNIVNAIDPLKDVDGLTNINIAKLANNKETLIPCTALGIIELLKYYNIEISGKNVTIIGRSNLVGKPLLNLFINNNATVTICHKNTKNLNYYTKNADILVVAIGQPNFINSKDIKENSVIIDVGINKLEDGSICGDVDYFDVLDKASFITPVPGGVGQMTTIMLTYNLYKAYNLKNRK